MRGVCAFSGKQLNALQEINKAKGIARRMNKPSALAKTLIDRGNVILALGNREDGRRAFEAALAAAETADDRARQSDALGNLGNIAFYDGDFALVENYHRRSLAISQTLADQQSLQQDLNNLSQTFWELGRYTKAVETETRALEIARSRNDVENIERYGRSSQRMQQALGNYTNTATTEATERAPTLPDTETTPKSRVETRSYSVERRIRLLLNEGQLDSARKVLGEELRATPDDPSIRCLSGVIKFIAGEFENARAEFERAIELSPDYMDPHYRLVDLCTKTQQLAPLQKRYEKLVADEPFRATARVALALVYSRTDQMDRAIQEALQAVRLAPREELALRVLAETQILKARSLLRSEWDASCGKV